MISHQDFLKTAAARSHYTKNISNTTSPNSTTGSIAAAWNPGVPGLKSASGEERHWTCEGPGKSVPTRGVAFLIMWHTSVLTIWHNGSKSRERTCKPDTFLPSETFRVGEGTTRTMVCQIIRTTMCQIISKTTAKSLTLNLCSPESDEK